MSYLGVGEEILKNGIVVTDLGGPPMSVASHDDTPFLNPIPTPTPDTKTRHH
jgi:hypothetical protein